MSILQNLVAACQADEIQLRRQAQARIESWHPWLAPVSDVSPTGEDPGYDDDFQRIREEVNKLSGIDTGLICGLAEKLLTTEVKDIRIATYYCWARLHQDGEAGFAEGLELLAGLLLRFGMQLHPQRDRSRKAALEWLAGPRLLSSLSLYPEVVREDAQRTAGALLIIRDNLDAEPEASRPELELPRPGGHPLATGRARPRRAVAEARIDKHVARRATQQPAIEVQRHRSVMHVRARKEIVDRAPRHAGVTDCVDLVDR